MIAASLSAPDQAGRAEIDRPSGAVDRAILTRAAAEMTPDIAAGPVEGERRQRRRLQRIISRRCRRRRQSEKRRNPESSKHVRTFPIARAEIVHTKLTRRLCGGQVVATMLCRPDRRRRRESRAFISLGDEEGLTSGLVGAAGFEPTTCSTQNCRATRLRYTPNVQRAPSIHASPSASKPTERQQESRRRQAPKAAGQASRDPRLGPICCRTGGGRRGRRGGCRISARFPPPPRGRPGRGLPTK